MEAGVPIAAEKFERERQQVIYRWFRDIEHFRDLGVGKVFEKPQVQDLLLPFREFEHYKIDPRKLLISDFATDDPGFGMVGFFEWAFIFLVRKFLSQCQPFLCPPDLVSQCAEQVESQIGRRGKERAPVPEA